MSSYLEKKYYDEHKYCPVCGGRNFSCTLVGYVFNDAHPEDFKDCNSIHCHDCGYEGILHDCIANPEDCEHVKALNNITPKKEDQKLDRVLAANGESIMINIINKYIKLYSSLEQYIKRRNDIYDTRNDEIIGSYYKELMAGVSEILQYRQNIIGDNIVVKELIRDFYSNVYNHLNDIIYEKRKFIDYLNKTNDNKYNVPNSKIIEQCQNDIDLIIKIKDDLNQNDNGESLLVVWMDTCIDIGMRATRRIIGCCDNFVSRLMYELKSEIEIITKLKDYFTNQL